MSECKDIAVATSVFTDIVVVTSECKDIAVATSGFADIVVVTSECKEIAVRRQFSRTLLW